MEEKENTEEIKSFEDLSKTEKTEKSENDMILPEKEVDDLGRSYATGKRKDAVARVWLKQGSGNITVNGKLMFVYRASLAFNIWHKLKPDINEEVLKLLD